MRCLTEAAPHMARQEACEKYKVACVLYPQAEGAFAELDGAIPQSVDRCPCHPPTLQKDLGGVRAIPDAGRIEHTSLSIKRLARTTARTSHCRVPIFNPPS